MREHQKVNRVNKMYLFNQRVVEQKSRKISSIVIGGIFDNVI